MIDKKELEKTRELMVSVSHKHAKRSVTRPERLYLTPTGFILKIRTVSNLLLVHLRQAIEDDLEAMGQKPKPPVEVMEMPGPFQGEEIVNKDDPVYLDQVAEYEELVMQLLDELGSDFLIARGIVDVGVLNCPDQNWVADNEMELGQAWNALDPETQIEWYEEYPDWKQEAIWFREENMDIADLPESDMVLFASYIATASQNELTKLYNAIMATRTVASIFRLISNRAHDPELVGIYNGVTKEEGSVAIQPGAINTANGPQLEPNAGQI